MTGNANLKSLSSKIVDTISQIIAMGFERKVLSSSIVKELSDLSAIAGAIGIAEEKREAAESTQEMQRPTTEGEKRLAMESQHPLEGFETFRPLVEGERFRRTDATGSEAPGTDTFRSTRSANNPAASASPDRRLRTSQEADSATEYDFSDAEAFAKRYL